MHSSSKLRSHLSKPLTASRPEYTHLSDKNCWSNADAKFPDTTNTHQTELLDQIEKAFQKLPTLAHILHGERRIHQGGRGRRTALFPSRKCGGTVPLESRLELAHAVALERSSSIREYRTQAICIPLPGGRFAFPDFLVRTMAGEIEVHEVKPSIEHLSSTEMQRFATIRAMLSEIDVRLRLIDSSNLVGGRELNDLLYRFSRGHVRPYTSRQIDLAGSALSAQKLNSFAEAYALLQGLDLPIHLADYLNFHQQWKFTSAQKPTWTQGDL